MLYSAGEWWDPCDRDRWATSKRMLRAPHPEEGEQPDADQGETMFPDNMDADCTALQSLLLLRL